MLQTPNLVQDKNNLVMISMNEIFLCLACYSQNLNFFVRKSRQRSGEDKIETSFFKSDIYRAGQNLHSKIYFYAPHICAPDWAMWNQYARLIEKQLESINFVICYINRACSFHFCCNSIKSSWYETGAMGMLFRCLEWDVSKNNSHTSDACV